MIVILQHEIFQFSNLKKIKCKDTDPEFLIIGISLWAWIIIGHISANNCAKYSLFAVCIKTNNGRFSSLTLRVSHAAMLETQEVYDFLHWLALSILAAVSASHLTQGLYLQM